MEQRKSLRQIAKETGVSHAYLSQVLHGKRPASDKVQEALKMVSMVSKYEANSDLKSSALKRCVGSRPSPGTTKIASDLTIFTFFHCSDFVGPF